MSIELVIGAGDWGHGKTATAKAFAEAIRNSGSVIKTVDTAAFYPLPATGAAEKDIGEADYAGKGFTINTKVLYAHQGGCHTFEAVEKSVENSLQSLNISKVNILYAHGPDKKTPLATQAAAFDKEYKKGNFTTLGVANLDLDMLKEWISIADQNGYVKPTVYQGQYNILCRAHEDGILPFAREHGMSFMAYSPIAGGFLSGVPTFAPASDLIGTRFEHTDQNVSYGQLYRSWYDKDSMHAAVKKLDVEARRHKLQLPEIAMRWLMHHSELKEGDGIIIGPETVEQLENYIVAYNAGPLPEDLVKTIDELQALVGEDAKSLI